MGESIHGMCRMLEMPQSLLRFLGIGSLDSFSFAMSYAQSRLTTVPEVKDFGCVQGNNTLKMFAYIDVPNEQVEKRIYGIYGELLDLFPNTDVDISIVELYGRSKEEMQSLGL
jgi:hypothetical protein